MPVGTYGAVKGLAVDRLEQLGAAIVLANTYHLWLRPGVETISSLGGVHRFTGWKRAMLTDSGGFQVMSLSGIRKVREEGVEFRSHLDGSLHFLSPEESVRAQGAFGVDIAMVLDECIALPAPREEVERAMERTHRWAERSKKAWNGDGNLFGIVQGGTDRELRLRSAARLTEIGFDGYAIGGLAVGEAKEAMDETVAATAAALPFDRPRYLMGVGTPEDILRAVLAGVDMFDCVMPTRNARNGTLFTSRGLVRIKRAEYAADGEPLDPDCRCPTCARYSRAFLRHLYLARDLTAPVLLTIHNVAFYLDFMARIREAIASAALPAFTKSWLK
jgi:queuine tRNA-ribosyltransferase